MHNKSNRSCQCKYCYAWTPPSPLSSCHDKFDGCIQDVIDQTLMLLVSSLKIHIQQLTAQYQIQLCLAIKHQRYGKVHGHHLLEKLTCTGSNRRATMRWGGIRFAIIDIGPASRSMPCTSLCQCLTWWDQASYVPSMRACVKNSSLHIGSPGTSSSNRGMRCHHIFLMNSTVVSSM